MAAHDLLWPADNPSDAETVRVMNRERNRCQGNRGIPEQAEEPPVRICREMSLDIRFADHPLVWERGRCAFPCFRRGRVRAEPGRRVKGRVPCGFLGQRLKPSESLPDPIFASFQGSDRPFFRPCFFIDYLTLPNSCDTGDGRTSR